MIRLHLGVRCPKFDQSFTGIHGLTGIVGGYREYTDLMKTRNTLQLTGLSLALALAGTAPSALADAPAAESATYILAQITEGAAASQATSTTYILDGVAGQPGVIGESTSATYIVQSGFFTSGHDQPVPVELMSFEIDPEN